MIEQSKHSIQEYYDGPSDYESGRQELNEPSNLDRMKHKVSKHEEMIGVTSSRAAREIRFVFADPCHHSG